MFKALDLACYIMDKHFVDKGREISNIKLQKSLYFLFAYWGGYIEKNRRNLGTVEQDLSSYDSYLFDERIEAWTYGPVVPDVYRNINLYYSAMKENEQLDEIKNGITSKYDGFVSHFINDWLNDMFSISDFKLVEMSHNDDCWSKNYDPFNHDHNKEIEKDDIINLYAENKYI